MAKLPMTTFTRDLAAVVETLRGPAIYRSQTSLKFARFNRYCLPLLATVAVIFSGCSLPRIWQTRSVDATGPYRTGKTLAETQLERILTKQEKLLNDLSADLGEASTFEQQQKINEVDTAYRSFILDNPEYIYGYILYGKFLRAIGDFETANVIFVKANDLEGDYAVIKQQIGNYLAEEGEYGLALAYFMSAIDLEPKVALYHFQLGELLHTYRNAFVAGGELAADVVARQQFNAFANAARLDPDNRTFQMRYAEAFFDAAQPDWRTALRQWQALATNPSDEVERQIIELQKARVHIELDQYDAARASLAEVTRASLQTSKQQLLDKIGYPQP